MAAVLKHWRESASLILVTSSNLSKNVNIQLCSSGSRSALQNNLNSLDDFNLLLLKRSSKSKFMPNMYVFPGGVAVDNDFSASWLSVFNKLGQHIQKNIFDQVTKGSVHAAPIINRKRSATYSAIPPDVAFRICAIRETFEESGILLAQPVKQSKDTANFMNKMLSPALVNEEKEVISHWRQRVNKDPNEFLNMCLELDLVPEIWSLYEWSNWLTPTMSAENQRRFDAVFYVCCIDHKPDAVVDAGETVNALWASPSATLLSYYKTTGSVPTPQVYELSRLLNFKTATDLFQSVARPDRDRVERWFPVVMVCKTHYLAVMPGDDLYPKEPDLFSPESLTVLEDSLDDLSQRHPNHHRSVALLDKNRASPFYHIQCTIQPQKGHVAPAIEVLNQIIMTAKL